LSRKNLGVNNPRVSTHVTLCFSDYSISVFHCLDLLRYDERMKSKLDHDTTPAQKYKQFQGGLRQVLTVSKAELMEREKQYQGERANKPKRGPKRHSSASDHASRGED